MKAHSYFGEGEIGSVPRVSVVAVSAVGFTAFPIAVAGPFGDPVFQSGAQEIYRRAYEQARACASPAWHLCSLLSAKN